MVVPLQEMTLIDKRDDPFRLCILDVITHEQRQISLSPKLDAQVNEVW